MGIRSLSKSGLRVIMRGAVSPMTIDLAEEFRILAADESWPWTLEPTVKGQDLHKTIIKYGNEHMEWFQVNHIEFAAFTAESPLVRAKLALMVVEWKAKHNGVCTGLNLSNRGNLVSCISVVLEREGITPSDYENVKARVEEAEK